MTDPRPARPWRHTALAAGLLALAGCSQFQPHQRPDTALPSAWQGSDTAVPGDAAVPPLPWQDFVADPALRALVQQALDNNRNARVAAAQVEQLRAQYRIRSAARLPTVNAGVTGNRQTTGENEPIQSVYSAGLQVSGWEIDFFGRLESLREAARAQFLASEEALRATRIGLVAAVSSAWLDLQASTALRALTQQTLANRDDALRLTRLRFEHGAASALELRQAESLVASARATLAEQTRQQALARNALALLVGQPLSGQAGRDAPLRADPEAALAEVPVGLPSRVLLERPDIRAAEQQLAAANAQIGAARAAFFPRIALTASVGSASTELSGLLGSGSWGWTLAPQALLPIFDGGTNRAGLASAQAGREAALAQYEQAIQTAFKDVNDALAGRDTLGEQLAAQQALVQSETERLRLSALRLEQGVASQLEVLDAQRGRFSAEQALVQTRYARLQNRVALYRAMGGF
ncbi:efflux transporter outer membrane subunit [Aquabacterium sp. A08]|uniref:efflux transporter outer membrane subunit n=1 Tax=Aquabacterium sp. A08 TaxID=2718532 RepID=UPI0014217B57|nr:efflux transporter outer membrane subunit [Aquabacterium sp. A08]NIC42844.1 efflux transporter outer membrane subunit [Aquabacterium sp. A08]